MPHSSCCKPTKYKYNTGSSNVTYNQDLALLKNISIEEIEGTQIPLEENINTTTQHNKSHVKVHSVEAIAQKLIKASYHQAAIIECWKKKVQTCFPFSSDSNAKRGSGTFNSNFLASSSLFLCKIVRSKYFSTFWSGIREIRIVEGDEKSCNLVTIHLWSVR